MKNTTEAFLRPNKSENDFKKLHGQTDSAPRAKHLSVLAETQTANFALRADGGGTLGSVNHVIFPSKSSYDESLRPREDSIQQDSC